MKAISWLFAGMIGGLIGAALWAGTVYYSGWEIGIIAWLIGVFAGVGVRSVAGRSVGGGPAAVAMLCAVVCVLAGKLGSIALMLYADQPTQEDALVVLSDTVVRQYEREGRQINWRFGTSVENAYSESDYPTDIWAQAQTAWYDIPVADRERYLTSYVHLTLLDTEYVVSYIADEIVDERLMAGAVGGLSSGGFVMEDYDPGVWSEAVSRWNTMSPDERRSFEGYVLRQEGVTAEGAIDEWVVLAVALASLGIWDILWLGLATLSAWKLGYGAPMSDAEQQAVMMASPKQAANAGSKEMAFGRPVGGGENAAASTNSAPMGAPKPETTSEAAVFNPSVRAGMADEAEEEMLNEHRALFDDDPESTVIELPPEAPKPMTGDAGQPDADEGGAFFKARRAG